MEQIFDGRSREMLKKLDFYFSNPRYDFSDLVRNAPLATFEQLVCKVRELGVLGEQQEVEDRE